jgi:hypothetical protein
VNEGLLLGLAIAGLIWLAMWPRPGVRPRAIPSRESLAFVALGIALWLVLRQSGVLDPSTSVFVGFVAAAIVLGLWRRFAHRPI